MSITKERASNTESELTISLLNIIFSYAAHNAHEALLVLGLVRKQWREAVIFHCSNMWSILVSLRWPATRNAVPLRPSQRLSFQAYERRAVTGLGAARDFAAIENCAEPQYAFRCPILASNLVRKGPDLFFCDVCSRDVHALPANATQAQLDQHALEDKCVVFLPMPQVAALKLHDELFRPQAETQGPPPMPMAPNMVRIHVAVLTSDPATGVHCDDDAASNVLRSLAKKLRNFDLTTHERFLSRDLFVASNANLPGGSLDATEIDPNARPSLGPSPTLHFHAVTIRVPAQGASATTIEQMCADKQGSALGRTEMPSGGWSYIVFADKTAASLFSIYDGSCVQRFKGTIVGALLATNRYAALDPADGPAGKIAADSQMGAVQSRRAMDLAGRLAEYVNHRVQEAAAPLRPPPPPPGMPMRFVPPPPMPTRPPPVSNPPPLGNPPAPPGAAK